VFLERFGKKRWKAEGKGQWVKNLVTKKSHRDVPENWIKTTRGARGLDLGRKTSELS